MKTVYKLGKEEIFLTIGYYMTTMNTAVNATCKGDGEPYCTLTVNLDKLEEPSLAYLNINLYGIDVENFITANGLGVKIEGGEKQSGHVTYPLYRLNLKKIRDEE